jgi:hypothetical protein
VTSLPPNPNELLVGRRSHLGGCLSDKVPPCEDLANPGTSKMSAPSVGVPLASGVCSLVVWMEWIPTVPSKKAVASRSGLRGHQSTWKAQLSADGS